MLCSTFLVLLIHLGPWSLKEGWHIYKIVETVTLTGMVFLALSIEDWDETLYLIQWYLYRVEQYLNINKAISYKNIN